MGKRYGWRTFIPAFAYCTDNAAMIAISGYYEFLAGKFDELDVRVRAR
jgi:N6-L-threonylcarbamoyladenine synthase